jgi:flagellar biosynthesis/type III secretory pathway protein FliH
MIPRPVADYLIEIGPGDAPPPILVASPEPDLTPLWPEEPEEDPQIAIDAAREEGRAAGLEEARTQCAADYAAELAAAHARFGAELTAARESWAHEEGAHLREQLAAAMLAMEERLADSVARVLRPFIVAALRRQMIDKLIENVRTIAGSAEKIAIEIAGPADLIEILRTQLEGVPAAFKYVMQDGVDVSVVADQTSIGTQLKAWTDLIGVEA